MKLFKILNKPVKDDAPCSYETSQGERINFNSGYVSYSTDTYKETMKNSINLTKIEGNLIRLEFRRCHTKSIISLAKTLFRHKKQNLENLIFVRFNVCYRNHRHLLVLLKMFKSCSNLQSLYFYQTVLTEKFLLALHDMVVSKFIQGRPVNLMIMSLYIGVLTEVSNKEKLGLVFMNIAMSCNKYFSTFTDKSTNKLYMKYFLTGADILSRKNSRLKICLGSYIKERTDKRYSTYKAISQAGEFALYNNIPSPYRKEIADHLWPVKMKQI